MLCLDKDKRGFTLSEILVAVLIVGIALSSIAFVFARAPAFITRIRQEK